MVLGVSLRVLVVSRFMLHVLVRMIHCASYLLKLEGLGHTTRPVLLLCMSVCY